MMKFLDWVWAKPVIRTLIILGLFFAPGDRLLDTTDSASAQVSNVGTSSGQPAGSTYANNTASYTQNGIPSFVKTYRLAVYNQSWASQSGNLVQIQGSSTKTIRITKVLVDGQATGAAFAQAAVTRASAAESSGTCTSQTGTSLGSLDTNNTTPTATVTLCTAAATAGTTAGTIDTCRLFVGVVGTPSVPDICAFTYGINDDQMLTLRGTGDYIGISTGSFGAGGVVDVVVEWLEEP